MQPGGLNAAKVSNFLEENSPRLEAFYLQILLGSGHIIILYVNCNRIAYKQ
jgi:hypothetical protein